MKIERLELKNFRGIREMTLDFSPKVNVLVGVNGAGKSSILDALAILLSRLIGRLRSTSGTGRFFVEKDIRDGSSETVNTLQILLQGTSVKWTVAKARKGRRAQTITNQGQLKEIASRVHDLLEQDPKANIPLAVFYGVNRAVVDIPLRIRTRHEFDQLTAFDQALTGERNDFRLFFEWFREREDYENEIFRTSSAARRGKSGRDKPLTAVRNAIQTFTGFTDLRIRRQPLRMEARKDEHYFTIQQLSDGEKCLLALVGDLARRLAIANPGLPDPLTGSAVVLIDEIDLHLHPSWQRMIIPKLTETFPNCQIIVSTHSPQILGHIEPENIFLLQQTEEVIAAVRPNESFGKNSDGILEDLMGVSARPEWADKELGALFTAIEMGQLARARKKAERLRGFLKSDPELLKADLLIKRKEVLGK
jgi:predicted ATP-binding protein involved in virulence